MIFRGRWIPGEWHMGDVEVLDLEEPLCLLHRLNNSYAIFQKVMGVTWVVEASNKKH